MIMGGFLRDMRIALRSLGRIPGFTAAAIGAIALGIGTTTAIFSVVNGVLLRPLPYPEQERLVNVRENLLRHNLFLISASVAEFLDFRTEVKSFADAGAWTPGSAALTGGEHAERLQVGVISSGLFSTLGISAWLGRNFLPEEDEKGRDDVVLLSHRFWATRFKREAGVVGRTLSLDGVPRRIVGVLPEGVDYRGPNDVFVPIGIDSDLRSDNQRGSRSFDVVARLRPGVTLQQAQRDVDAVAERMRAAHPGNYPPESGWTVTLQLTAARMVAKARPSLLLLLGAVAFVLLIACADVANLLLARATARQRELAVRSALGAGRWVLVRETLAESAALSLAGGAGGVLLGAWAVDVMLAVAPGLPRTSEIHLDMRVLLFAFTVTAATALLAGLVPALQASRVDAAWALKEGGQSGIGRRTTRLRSALVVAEVSLALVLLVGAGLLLRSFGAVLRADVGFDAGQVFTASISLGGARYDDPPARATFWRDVQRRIADIPGVEAAGAANLLPLQGRTDRTFRIEGWEAAPGEPQPDAEFRAITPGYLEALRIPLREGRGFTGSDDASAPLVVLVSRAFVHRYFPDGRALGRRIRWGGGETPWRTVVGVVGDVRDLGLDVQPEPAYYAPVMQFPMSQLSLAVRTRTDLQAVAATVRKAVEAVDASQPVYGDATMAQVIAASVAPRRFVLQMLAIFAAIALLLSAVGIYGVISYSVAQRTQEIGVRMAVGARPRDVLRLVMGQALRLAAAGVGLGLAAAIGLSRLLAGLLYGVSVRDPLTYAGIAILLGAVALAASAIPALRAARVDPMAALRTQ
jgi:putative ABC transport system permease protein